MSDATRETAPTKSATGIKRAFWLLCAVVFLTEAWLWDHVGDLLKPVTDLIPFAAFKQELARQLDKLPPILALLVFAFPVSAMEACKAFGVWTATHGYPAFGILIFALANALGVGAAAFLFDSMRQKLLSIEWFSRAYDLVLDLRARAEAIIRPYKDQVRIAIISIRRRLNDHWKLLDSRRNFVRRLSLLRRWVWRARSSRSTPA
jgi:hypothetical protein